MATTLNISLPKELRDFVVREASRGGYGSASEFVREVLRETISRRAQQVLEKKLLRSLASPLSEMTDGDWRRLHSKYGSRRRRHA